MKKRIVCLLCLILSLNSFSQRKLTVVVDKPIASVAPTMWGIFFEDINLGADGGLYAELVKNRSFEFSTPLMGWKEMKEGGATGNILINNRSAENKNNPRYARITYDVQQGKYGLLNEGFRGMGIKKDMQYHFSVWSRTVEGEGKLRLELVDAKK